MFFYRHAYNVAFGYGAVGCIGDKLKEMNCSRPLICCDDGIIKFGLLEKLTGKLTEAGISYKVYGSVTPEPSESIVKSVCEILATGEIDCLIAIGGGSSIDVAKAANVLHANGKLIQDDPRQPINPGMPVIAIPTTSGTGSDQSSGAMVTNDATHAKMGVPAPLATLSICDPELTMTLPKGATLAGAVDALTHAFEGYTSVYASRYSDLLCENCIQAVHKYLPVIMENGSDQKAREELMFASSSCGSVIATTYLNAGHAIGHAIGGALRILHGFAVIAVAPALLRLQAAAIPEKARRICQLLEIPVEEGASAEDIGEALCEGLVTQMRSWGVKNLKELGCTMEDLDACIPAIMSDYGLYFSPKQLTAEDIHNILQHAYEF